MSKSQVKSESELLASEFREYDREGQVRIIGFITSPDQDSKFPIPDNYLTEIDTVPDALKDELRSVAWSDSHGTVWFPEGFRPRPVKGSDGNVYLAIGSDTMEDEILRVKAMTEAMSLLNGERTVHSDE
jgi:hypothetical protein